MYILSEEMLTDSLHEIVESMTICSQVKDLFYSIFLASGSSVFLSSFFFFLFFPGPYSEHMEVPRLGVELEL